MAVVAAAAAAAPVVETAVEVAVGAMLMVGARAVAVAAGE